MVEYLSEEHNYGLSCRVEHPVPKNMLLTLAWCDLLDWMIEIYFWFFSCLTILSFDQPKRCLRLRKCQAAQQLGIFSPSWSHTAVGQHSIFPTCIRLMDNHLITIFVLSNFVMQQ